MRSTRPPRPSWGDDFRSSVEESSAEAPADETSATKAEKTDSAGPANALTNEEKLVGKTLKKNYQLTRAELSEVNTKKGLLKLLSTKNVDVRCRIL